MAIGKDWLFILITRVLNLASGFLMVWASANWLGPDGRGQASIFLSQSFLIYLGAQFSGGAAMGFFAGKYHHQSLLKMAMPRALTLLIMGCLLSYLHNGDLIFTSLCLILAFLLTLGGYVQHIHMGLNRQKVVNRIMLIQNAGPLLFFAILHWTKEDTRLTDFMIASLASQALMVFYGWIQLRKSDLPELLPKEVKKEFWTKGLWAQTGSLLQFLQYRLCLFLLLEWEGPALTGVVSVALALGEGLWIPARSGAQWILGKTFEQGGQMKNQVYRQSLIALLLSATGGGVMLMIPSHWYSAWLGEGYKELPMVLMLMMPAWVLFSSQFSITHFFSGLGQYGKNTMASGAGLLMQVLWSIPLYQLFKAEGILMAVSMGLITGTVVSWWTMLRNKKLKKPYILPG